MKHFNEIGAFVVVIIGVMCVFMMNGADREMVVFWANVFIIAVFGGIVLPLTVCLLNIYKLRKQAAKNARLHRSIENYKVYCALVAIAASNKDGFTVDRNNLQPVTDGFAVAVADTQNSFNANGLAKVVEFVANNPQIPAFGGWYNEQNKMFYWDATIVYTDKNDAIDAAKRNNQIEAFDLKKGEPIGLQNA